MVFILTIFKSKNLMPVDLSWRLEFCRIILNHHQHNVEFIHSIVFIDAATFKRDGLLNLHNARTSSSCYHWQSSPAPVLSRHMGSNNMWIIARAFHSTSKAWCITIFKLIRKSSSWVNGKNSFKFKTIYDWAPAHFSVPVGQYLNKCVFLTYGLEEHIMHQ